jgi:hypothetical protein
LTLKSQVVDIKSAVFEHYLFIHTLNIRYPPIITYNLNTSMTDITPKTFDPIIIFIGYTYGIYFAFIYIIIANKMEMKNHDHFFKSIDIFLRI